MDRLIVLALGAGLIRTPEGAIECADDTQVICRTSAWLARRFNGRVLVTAGEAPDYDRVHMAQVMADYIRREVPGVEVVVLKAPRFNSRSEIRTAGEFLLRQAEIGQLVEELKVVSEHWREKRVGMIAKKIIGPSNDYTRLSTRPFFDNTVTKAMLRRERLAYFQNWLWLKLGLPD